MTFNHLSPMLYTRDIKTTISFYVNILGFTNENFSEEWGWARVERNDVQLMFCLPNEHIPFDKPTFTGSIYINVTGADALWQHVKDKVTVCYPIENFEYGMREFAIYDNNGYLLQFGENIPEAS